MSWSKRIRLRHLQILIRLCELKSMSDVARQSNMTQPALSKWLKDLEDDAGVILFERHARGIEPLPPALELARQAQGVLSRLDHMGDSLDQYRLGFRQSVTLGVSPMVAVVYLSALMRDIHQRHPYCHFRIQEGTLDILSRGLEQGELDLVIGRIDETGRNPSMAFLHLGLVPLCVAVGQSNPLADRHDLAWDEVSNQPWILPPKGSPMRSRFELALDTRGLHHPRCAIESAHAHTNALMAIDSPFLVPMARTMAQIYPDLRILDLGLEEDTNLHGQLGLLWRPEDTGQLMLKEITDWMLKKHV